MASFFLSQHAVRVGKQDIVLRMRVNLSMVHHDDVKKERNSLSGEGIDFAQGGNQLPFKTFWSCPTLHNNTARTRGIVAVQERTGIDLCRFLCHHTKRNPHFLEESRQQGRASAPRRFIIFNLIRRADRRAFMRKKVEKFRKRIEFRDAFDCKANDQCVQYHSRARSHYCVLGVCGKTFSEGAVGILYSLNMTLSELLVSGVEEVTVMDDDIYFRKEAIGVADKL